MKLIDNRRWLIVEARDKKTKLSDRINRIDRIVSDHPEDGRKEPTLRGWQRS
jgi:hypothetical protein